MMSQEMSYQTARAGSDVSGGGVRLNMIPKEGGNRFSGAFFGAWSDGAWQSNNLTSSLRWGVDAPIADTYYTPAGSNYATTYPQCTSKAIQCEQGIDDQHIKSAMVRLTWQVSPRNKFAADYDKVGKDRGQGMNAGDDPATASQIWTSPAYMTG